MDEADARRVADEIERCRKASADATDLIDARYCLWRAEMLEAADPAAVLHLLREEMLRALAGRRSPSYPEARVGGDLWIGEWWNSHRQRKAREAINRQRERLGLAPIPAPTLIDNDNREW